MQLSTPARTVRLPFARSAYLGVDMFVTDGAFDAPGPHTIVYGVPVSEIGSDDLRHPPRWRKVPSLY